MKRYKFYREDAPDVTIEREGLIPGPLVKTVTESFAKDPPADDEFVVVAEYTSDEGVVEKLRYEVEIEWIATTYMRKARETQTDKPISEGCAHEKLGEPAFDKKAAEGLTVGEVRARWPRTSGYCHACGRSVIKYASFEHYLAGDW